LTDKIKVLFVCLGNICRSPAAEGAFKKLVYDKGLEDLFLIDSAGTANYHIGELAHETTRKVAMGRGIDLTHLCRQVKYSDFEKFDFIIPMDSSNQKNLFSLARTEQDRKKIIKFRKFDTNEKGEPDVPDPYYGEVSGFEHVQDIVELCSLGLLNWILENHPSMIKE
jgi:protein-tyrosine phosphatase